MTLHELSTNAVKYGALSVPGGRVALSWTVEPGRQGVPTLVLEWRESGGPAIAGPVTPGFGTKLVRRALASESGAQVSLTFPHEGAHFVARVPIRPDIMR
jgi:two-component sensor histidine kinase